MKPQILIVEDNVWLGTHLVKKFADFDCTIVTALDSAKNAIIGGEFAAIIMDAGILAEQNDLSSRQNMNVEPLMKLLMQREFAGPIFANSADEDNNKNLLALGATHTMSSFDYVISVINSHITKENP